MALRKDGNSRSSASYKPYDPSNVSCLSLNRRQIGAWLQKTSTIWGFLFFLTYSIRPYYRPSLSPKVSSYIITFVCWLLFRFHFDTSRHASSFVNRLISTLSEMVLSDFVVLLLYKISNYHLLSPSLPSSSTPLCSSFLLIRNSLIGGDTRWVLDPLISPKDERLFLNYYFASVINQ